MQEIIMQRYTDKSKIKVKSVVLKKNIFIKDIVLYNKFGFYHYSEVQHIFDSLGIDSEMKRY